MSSNNGGYLITRNNVTDRQTDMDRPLRCSSLTLEREDHQIIPLHDAVLFRVNKGAISTQSLLLIDTETERTMYVFPLI